MSIVAPRWFIVPLALILGAIAPHPVAADDAAALSPKQAASDFLEQSVASVLKSFRKDTKLLRAELFGEFSAIDAEIASGAVDLTVVTSLFDALRLFQVAMRSEFSDASTEYRDGMKAAVAILNAGGIEYSNWPVGFYFGDGGTSDELRADIESEARKRYDEVTDRLRKTAKRLREHAAIAMQFRLEPSRQYFEFAVAGDPPIAVIYPDAKLSIDIALAASRIGVNDDGMLLLAGNGSDVDGAVDLHITGWTTVLDSSHPTVSNSRWSRVLSALPEAPCSIRVRAGMGTNHGGAVTATISIR